MKNQLLMATIATLTACTGSPNYWRTYTPASGHTTKPIDAATAAIVSAGYEVDTTTPALVTSKWFHGSSMGTEDFRLMVTLNNGDYRVEALCKETGNGACDDTKRPQFVLDAVAKVEASLK